MNRGNRRGSSGRAFTLIELLVVVSIIALLVSILLPSLARARQQTQMVMCLTNLKQLGNGIQIYSGDSGGVLPGPIHPALYRDLKEAYPDTMGNWQFWRGRMLTWLLRNTFKDSSSGGKGNIVDKVATCPVLLKIVPDSHFTQWRQQNPSRSIYPTHYVANSHSADVSEGSGNPHEAIPLGTKPPCYFGWSYADALESARAQDKPPQQLGAIKSASAEWAVADAWFRTRDSTVERLRMAGPYQFAWTGEALPYFAPHMRKRGASNTVPLNPAERTLRYNPVFNGETDGMTCTVFFDGHGATVRSRSIIAPVGNNMKLFYGFPGTRNWYGTVPQSLAGVIPPPI